MGLVSRTHVWMALAIVWLCRHAAALRALVGEAVQLMAPDPAEALRRGSWFKLICGASYQVRWWCFRRALDG